MYAPGLKSLSSISREYGEVVINDLLVLSLDEVFAFYGEQIPERTIYTLVEQIRNLGYYLTGADIQLFKIKCLSGGYHKKYRLSPDVMMEWFKDYLAERQEQFSKQTFESHRVEMLKANAFNQKTLDLFKGIFKETRDKSEEIRLKSNHIMEEFKQLQINQGVYDGTEIEYKGKNMNLTQYIDLRLTEL